MARPPTMRDVAAAARVSQRTVSNVVNDYEHVSAQTRQRVLEAIEKLGYRPNVSAQRLRTGRTGIIALAIPNISWPYFGELAHLVQLEAQKHGFTVLISETDGSIEHELNVLSGFNSNVIDGLILSSIEADATDIEKLKSDTPVVLIGERIRQAGVPHFEVDSDAAGRDIANHLCGQGAQEFLIVGSKSTTMTLGPGPLRYSGFYEGLVSNGISDSQITSLEASPWTYGGGYEAVSQWLANANAPDAIIAMNDIMGLGAIRALADFGFSVPGDVLVTGWDDTLGSTYSVPSLTTIRPNLDELARRSVAALVELTEGKSNARGDHVIEHELVIRESSSRLQRV